ncbi:hypothetical protein A0H81_04822 [Grifola frondosa]|uniref:Uncharacterized protein n=1 Tax=Grifola frondosa TaxID=5627 RepID=A0A1C7MGQ0_GRIFR|nr:hypothetical protein A0H81_04822 [Grifola frondosa]
MTVPLRYSDACTELPASRPVGFPHIINVQGFDEETDKKDLRAADGIATLLYNWKPEALRALLDLNRPRFEFKHKGSYYLTMIIARHGMVVSFGFYDSDVECRTQMIYRISVTGEWIPLSGMFEGLNADGRTRPKIVESFGTEFAKDILYNRKWEEREGIKIEAWWTKMSDEEEYGEIDEIQHDMYGLPHGWQNMTDNQIKAKLEEK